MRYLAMIPILLLLNKVLGQNPLRQWTDAVETRYDAKAPHIRYIVGVDSTDLSSITVEMHIRQIPDSFRVAMAAHPEYDDRYWRFVKKLTVSSRYGEGRILRVDSSLWQVYIKGGEAVLYYIIQLPHPRPGMRAAWRPFLSPTGGLVGGIQTFMYIVGHELTASHVEFKIPESWEIATGLEPTAVPHVFFAPSAFILTDCPVLMGRIRSWSFLENGVPHRIVYWPSPGGRPFDTVRLVNHVHQLVNQAANIFGRLPYREYCFLFQDNAYGALEHSNSVTIGIPSGDIADHPDEYLEEIAHEYFHTWNIVRIHPAEYGDVRYQTPPYSPSLWWSEGLTMFYADLMIRRAGLPLADSTRVSHLESLIKRYYEVSGNHLLSPEKVSLASNAPNGILGDYSASTHLQGELLGAMMDLVIRDRTDGLSSIDDVMREMMVRFSSRVGFTGQDIEGLVSQSCHCPINGFFDKYIRGTRAIEFNDYLGLIGLHADTSWEPVRDTAGKPAPDLRVYAWQKAGESAIRIGITDPAGCWGKAGIHTGDILEAINGMEVKSTADFRSQLGKIKTGDVLVLSIQSPQSSQSSQSSQSPQSSQSTYLPVQKKISVSGYLQPLVHIRKVNGQTQKQRKLYDEWALGR